MITPKRYTLTTDPKMVADNPAVAGSDERTISYVFVPQTSVGTILIGGSSAGPTAAGGDNAVRWDVSTLATFTIDLEPGEELWMKVASGTINIDTIRSGR